MSISLETIIHYFPEEVQDLVHLSTVTDIMIVGERIFIEECGEMRPVQSKIDAFSLRTAINYIAVQCDETINEHSPIMD